ncbi:PH domain-containing protein [Streptomyces endophyticus]|uniref:PH domain-containing protein n=1 Tax=Streptomyces endophyticus TaxID=714166 RepID=A0ABU6F6Y1_9ACTN|nr:PH domain-containing protein [Streptomyces endophyticus]MEB8338577.1 PH domain-containing protein [Streptomyces endophyticus]
MTSSQTTPPQVHDRSYRSAAGIAGGVVLILIGAWLGADAVVNGVGRTPWTVLAVLLLVVPLVVAFTIRPAVFGNEERLRVRNPFRDITLPWSAVSGFKSGYSNEVFDQAGTKYQLWSIPVSLRGRRKAQRQQLRAAKGGRTATGAAGLPVTEPRSPGDQAMDELRDLHETHAKAETPQSATKIRWAYEILAPALAGAVLLVALLALG